MSVFTTQHRTCSFCSGASGDETLIAGGTGSVICADCVDRYQRAIAAREVSAEPCLGAWRAMDKAQLLEQFVAVLRQRAQVDTFARDWVTLMKERGISWSEIGGALGVTRQAAWERFSKPRRA